MHVPEKTGDGHGGVAAWRLAWLRARQSWPNLDIELERFVAYVREVAGLAGAWPEIPAELHVSDLYLACGCASGDARAAANFRHALVEPLAPMLAPRTGTHPDDLAQMLCERVLVAEEGRAPRIRSYAGRGPLVVWVRMAMMRVAINARPADGREVALRDDEVLADATLVVDPDMLFLRNQHGPAFRAAFEATMAALEPEDRNLLRLHFVDGVPGEALATMRGVARRTVHRWLERIREEILSGTRARMAAALNVTGDELDALMRDLQSALATALLRHLGGDGGGR